MKPYVEPRDYQRFTVQAINVIDRICGLKSAHYDAIQKKVAAGDANDVEEVIGILEAAQADHADGFLADIRYLVRADLIDDFLSQADALLHNGYEPPAASLAGAVLEDTLRKLCDKHGVPYDLAKTNIEALNVELARAAVYDKLVQKEITAKAHLRNEADHGHFANVKGPDVENMLQWIRRFVQEYLQ